MLCKIVTKKDYIENRLKYNSNVKYHVEQWDKLSKGHSFVIGLDMATTYKGDKDKGDNTVPFYYSIPYLDKMLGPGREVKQQQEEAIIIGFDTGDTKSFNKSVIVNKGYVRFIEVDPTEVELKHIGEELIAIRYKNE